MTRGEFIDGVTTWDELLNVVWDNSLDSCDEIYSEESRDEYIDEMVSDTIRHGSWRDVLENLSDIDTERYDYWIHDDWGEWIGLYDGDDYFGDYKGYVLEEMDNNDLWDEEEVEEGATEEIEEVEIEEEPVECIELEFSFDELVAESTRLIKPISEVARNKHNGSTSEDEIEEMEFDEFLPFDTLIRV